MSSPLTVSAVNDTLAALYPDAHCALDYRTPLELAVATILSAQCTDERVNSVTPELFSRFPTAKAYAQARREEVEDIIRPLGFFRNKAKHLIALGQELTYHYDGNVPEKLEELTALPGIGRKTAMVIRGNAFGYPSFAVDTHVTRVSQRLGLVKEKATPLAIEKTLTSQLDSSEWTMFSHRLIFHGRQVCTARTAPACHRCPLRRQCPSAH